ncbi:ovarian-specific serine/threonine-protein kinase Lok [Aricia agestis]|uniref:ovarian-specific serine/threonine-protein kinase Lok n=1 Tax=Aricia agestis TaxID=91739 RepID=UPI001C20A40B|nr:ovarian-specific serine/threonine-protein kinase Lok [Aricia agestis]
MCEDVHDTQNTQTQTQNSQAEWSQSNTPAFIPNIWGRLYFSTGSRGKQCWLSGSSKPEYYDLIAQEFTLGRALSSTIVIKKDIVHIDMLKIISKNHFVIRRDLSEALSPAILTDLSYNGTFINGIKIGKGNSRVLDDNDVIAMTPTFKMFVYKDLLKNEQDQVPKEIAQKYYISKTLGQGACGIVKLAFNKTTCTKYAIKIIKKCRLTNGNFHQLNNPEKIQNEIRILKTLNHPCIISTEEAYDFPDTVYIVLELMQGGELFDRIFKHGPMPENLARFMFRQIVLAVKYLHANGITHRDLKLENVLCESKDEETRVKITDFGLSKFVGEHSFMKTMCGTPTYAAPEVLRSNGSSSYGPEVDVWSLGVMFFICLVGYMPFSSDYGTPTVEQILKGQYRYSASHWRTVSLQAKLLMKGMLTVDVRKRITLQQILDHPWMQDDDVILKVDVLLCCNVNDIELDKENRDEENNNMATNDKVVKLAQCNNKRALSNSFSSCEPMPKKLRVQCTDDCNDTGSTTSYSD